jgi:hypothetical protein
MSSSMRPELLFFVGIDQIKLPNLHGKGERFLDKYLLTNDRTVVRILLEPVSNFIGSVEYDYLTNNCPTLAYRRDNITETEYENVRDNLDRTLVSELYHVSSFIQNLWVIKDNAAYFDRGWLCVKSRGLHHCHNNNLGSRISSSKGDFNSIEFSFEELKYARLPKMSLSDKNYESGQATALGHKTLRYQRFRYFISAARQTTDIGLKISQYITALEALVSSSSTEVTHQVSERIACLLEPPGSDRIDDYKRIKQAYGFRSKVVHGSTIKEGQFDQLRDTSDYLDKACRILTIKYVTDEDKFRDCIETDYIDAFFLGKLLAKA